MRCPGGARGVDELAGEALDQLAQLRVLVRLPALGELGEPVASAADDRVECPLARFGERATTLDQTCVDERALRVFEPERVERIGIGERAYIESGIAVEASEQPDLDRCQVYSGPLCESFQDAVCLLPAGEDAELAGELGERIGVLRDGKRLADARGRDGVAERQLFDEPGEGERGDADRRRDEEDDVERVRERLDVGVGDDRRKLRSTEGSKWPPPRLGCPGNACVRL